MKNLKKYLSVSAAACAAFAACVLSASCAGDEDADHAVTFHLARVHKLNSAVEGSREPYTLPSTSKTVYVDSRGFLYEGNILKASVAEVTLPDNSKERGFWFTTDEDSAKYLFSTTASNLGSYVILKFDDRIIGARLIDQPMRDGIFFLSILEPDDDIFQIVELMNKSADKAREKKKIW